MVLDRPHAVEAHLLRVHGLFDTVPDRLSLHVGCSELDLGFEDHRKLHGDSPSTLPIVAYRHPRWRRTGGTLPRRVALTTRPLSRRARDLERFDQLVAPTTRTDGAA